MNSRNLMLIVLLIVAGPLTLMLYLRGSATTMPASAPSAQADIRSTKTMSAAAATPVEDPPERAVTTKPARATEIKPPQPTAPTGPKTASRTSWPVDKYEVREVVLGSNDEADGFKLQVRLTSLGAAVKTVKLTDFFATVADKKRCKQEKDHEAYLRAVSEDVKLKGHYVLLKPVSVRPGESSTSGKKFYPMATRLITIITGGERILLNLSGPRWSAGEVLTKESKEGKITNESITFQTKIWRNEEPFLLLKKTYTLRKGSYSIDVRLEAENLCKTGKVEFSLTQFLATGLSKEDTRSDMRMLVYGQYTEGEVKVETESARDVGKMPLGLADAKDLGRSDTAEPVLWVGQTNKFFAALTYIIPKETGKLAAPDAQAAFFGAALKETSKSRTSLVGMNLGPYELKPGGSTNVSLDLFTGPKKRNLFDDTPLYRNLDYKTTLKADTCCTFCTIQPLTLGMMWLLEFFSKNVTFHNYGLAIMLLVILVRICLHPLMKKQQISMMRMQKLAPEMEKVKKKYANDKAKLNAEMMKLYKTQGATPLLGCLPMFLQMPILIALWTSINTSVELRHAAFLPVWIIDLAAPDKLIPFSGGGFDIPLIGSMIGPVMGFNLLPILLCVVMYLQMKMNPQMSGAASSPQQQSSQKMMKVMMPGMMLFFFYNAASGLTLYFMTSTFAGLVEQYIIRKHIRQKEADEAATETTIAIPGKRFRGQKPKKPKGPFQIKR